MINSLRIPELHQRFIDESVSRLKNDIRIQGVAAGGSVLLGTMDEFSDLDLVVVIDPKHYSEVMKERRSIAGRMGQLIDCFTGEHVGEPRLLICLYGSPLIHIDLKFVSFDDIEEKVENPVILWERDNVVSNVLYRTEGKFPEPQSEWVEERFWIWIHYCATKIGRGELFEALDFLSFLRNVALGPLLLKKNHARAQGVRKIEFYATSDEIEKLKSTIAVYDFESCYQALSNSIGLYKEIRTIKGNLIAEEHVTEYLKRIYEERNGLPTKQV